MNETNRNMLWGGFSLGGPRAPSRLDDVRADVRLSFRLTDLADEDVNSAKGDPVPILD